jgi:xanthine dehydrogenase accessory factor
MSTWVHELVRVEQKSGEAVIVTVLTVRGSTPREVGAKMVVSAAEQGGSIGGGRLEYDAVALARSLLGGARESHVHRFALGAVLGQCCGGLAEVLFEPVRTDASWIQRLAQLEGNTTPCVLVRPLHDDGSHTMLVWKAGVEGSLRDELMDSAAVRTAQTMFALPHPQVACVNGIVFEPIGIGTPNVVLFGAGHVGRALVRALSGAPGRLTWVDSRSEQFPATVAEGVIRECTSEPLRVVDDAPRGSDFVVMTHSHALDFELCARILERGDFRYFGMIGSKTKRRSFESRLRARGIPPERIARMQCPIGIAGISSKNPTAVAVAVAAQLLCAQEAELPAAVPPSLEARVSLLL